MKRMSNPIGKRTITDVNDECISDLEAIFFSVWGHVTAWEEAP